MMDNGSQAVIEWCRACLSRPRWLSIGGIDNTAEFRVSREAYERLLHLIRAEPDTTQGPETEGGDAPSLGNQMKPSSNEALSPSGEGADGPVVVACSICETVTTRTSGICIGCAQSMGVSNG